jgi:hypothetical protein
MACHATRVRIAYFNDDVHAALRHDGIDLFRVPAATKEPVEVRLELEAQNSIDAMGRIRDALRGVVAIIEFTSPPTDISGKRQGDGPPE